MNRIADMGIYVGSLSATLYDKCWWIDKLPKRIDTVVDFGCARGDLSVMIHRIAPGKFRYIGVDNSPDMISLAKATHRGETSFYVFDANRGFDARIFAPEHSVLVLNSVIHEILSYLAPAKQKELSDKLFGAGFRYVAIRDMHFFPVSLQAQEIDRINTAVMNSKYACQWIEFQKICRERAFKSGQPCFSAAETQIQEFLLKYRYRKNWDRESGEQYLWDWSSMLVRSGYIESPQSEYELEFSNRFYIPFLASRIKKDFGIVWMHDTHKKMLLRRRTS